MSFVLLVDAGVSSAQSAGVSSAQSADAPRVPVCVSVMNYLNALSRHFTWMRIK